MPNPSTLGAYLVAHRETRGLSVEEVAAGTRIAPRMIRALEADRLDDLLPSLYVRGFIRAYCESVGTAAAEALALYEEAVRDRQPAAAPSVPPRGGLPTPRPPRRSLEPEERRGAARGALGLTALLLVAGALYPLRARGLARSRRGGDPRRRSGAPVPATPTPSPPEIPFPVEPPPRAPAGPPRRILVIRANETTWVRVQPEDGPATVETLAPGAVREWRSTGRFRVTLGNAGGVRLELDGKALPVLGTRGQVVRDVVLPAKAEPGS